MSFSLSIPTGKPEGAIALTVDAGQMLFILGANGTGKSSLMQAFASANNNKTRRMTAHRQTWFRSGSPEFTGKQRADYELNVFHHDRQANARWMDDYSQQRAQVFSLLPKKGEVATGGKRTAEIDFAKCAQDEAARIEALINASDFVGVLQRYPIRESPALDAIAKALNFANRAQYEAAVRNLLVYDSEAVKRVRTVLAFLPADLIA
ncbi:MAG: ATP-binding cassette domain-containing protein [Nitrospira sp.]|nr:ATP-binding cassette domain-containing protein [Nitrospira sp.]MDH4368355.1 ATP-binding cassette domain-containing protein [Nitrospira sp.]MDH5496232.1 ATP-binding cassette domain-containing protein [Nitrospira sp.]MDH5724309.1 ATP-binding cassette domain-containing protein [Nitrospira sp.]